MPASKASWETTIEEGRKLVERSVTGAERVHRISLLSAALEVGECEYGAELYERAIEGLEWPEDAAPPRTDDRAQVVLDAYKAGEEKGKAAASWLLDGNSSMGDAVALLELVMDCELDIPAPLSGEWADGLTIGDVLGELDIPLDHEDADSILQAWEDGYNSGYYEEAERSARYLADSVD